MRKQGRFKPESDRMPPKVRPAVAGEMDGYTVPAPGAGKTSSLDRGGRVRIYPANKTEKRASYMTRLPVVVKQYDGRSIASDPFTDRDFINKPAVMQYDWQDINIAAQMGATGDSAAATYAGYVQNTMFNDIIRSIQSQRLINLSNITLNNPVAAPAFTTAFTVTSFQAWMNYYMKAALIVRCLESVYAAGDISFTLSQMASAVTQNKQQLDAVAATLKTFKVPNKLIAWIDKLSGVKITNDNEPAVIYGMQAAGAVITDLTVSANVAGVIAAAEVFITRLVNPGFGAGPGANYAADFATITSNFALAYGNQAVWPVKGASTSPMEYWQGYGWAAEYTNTTTSTFFTWPNSNVVDMIPILVPEGMSEEEGMFMASMLGGVRYCSDAEGSAIAGTPNMCGVYTLVGTQNAGFNNMTGGIYSQVGSASSFNEAGAGAATTVFTNIELEFDFWLPYARGIVTTTAGGYNADRRALRDLAIVKARRQDLWDASLIWIQECFLGELL